MTHHRSNGCAARAAAADIRTLATTLAAAVLLHGATAPAMAGPLADPTRPPAALSAPGGLAAAALPHQANRDTARAIAAAQRAADAPPPPPPPAPVVVQAVQLPTSGAAVALVDGRLVKAGDTLDGRAVLAIDAQGLLVKGPRGPERLWLLGGAPKQAAGSITHSQTARYQAAPQAEPGLAGTAGSPGAQAAVPLPGTGPASPLANSAGNSSATTSNTTSNTSAATTPLSLAKRTAP